MVMAGGSEKAKINISLEIGEGGKKNDKRFKTYITGIRVTDKMDYLIQCIEMNLAMEYRVINFDFYNDWINGTIYVPRFMRYVKPKKTAGKNGRIVKVKIINLF